MPPPTPTVLTRIDPAYPVLWRDADTVQFGLDGRIRLPLTAPWAEPLLQAMRSGFRRASFDVVAHGVGAPREAARALLQALEPVLITDPPPPAPIWLENVGLDDSRVQARMEIALRDEGVVTAARGAEGSVGIVLVRGAASAHQLALYMHDDLVHLPVAFEPGDTVVGPLIVPGRTPCLSCRDAHERERDAAWPSMHAQLIGADAGRITTARTAETAGVVAALVTEAAQGAQTRWVRISPDGRRAWRAATFHEECRCREQSFRSPRGIATVDALPGPPNATMRSPAFARPA